MKDTINFITCFSDIMSLSVEIPHEDHGLRGGGGDGGGDGHCYPLFNPVSFTCVHRLCIQNRVPYLPKYAMRIFLVIHDV